MNYRDEFKKLIESIKVNCKTPPEEFNKIMQPMIQFIQMNVPAPLYKFRECTENNLAAFDRDEIWLSRASQFNDVHDSLLFFDKHAMLEQARQTLSSESLPAAFQGMKQYLSTPGRFRFHNSDMNGIIENKINALDEQKFSELVQSFMENLEMYLDIFFGQFKNEIRNLTKMACFSADIKSPLMWAHYSDNHKGFALGYDFRGNNISQCANCKNRSCGQIKLAAIYPMVYSDERFNATQYGKWRLEQYVKMNMGAVTEDVFEDEFLFTKAALHKSNDWKYEDEWRIICSTPDYVMEQKDSYPIKKRPMAVYFGSEISDFHQKILTHIADEKGIAKYQMYVEDYSLKYELKYRPC